MNEKELETFCPTSRKDWRLWLKKNHRLKKSVWLVYYKKKSGVPSLTYNEAVDEAICFGWIDSTKKTIDDKKFMQFFSPRNIKTLWSKINKEKVAQLIKARLMTKAGHASISTAKQNGSWELLDHVESLKMPRDLSIAFRTQPGSKAYFISLSRSAQKAILQWLALAKLPETRQRRITEIVTDAAAKLKPKQFR